jgi:exonuclease III
MGAERAYGGKGTEEMRFLFWNTNNNEKIDRALMRLILQKDCDVIVLAEYDRNLVAFCNELNIVTHKHYNQVYEFTKGQKVHVITNTMYKVEVLSENYKRHKIILITIEGKPMIVAMIHNISKLNDGFEERKENFRQLIKEISEKEEQLNTKNTVVIGDFNANPFGEETVAANTLHAIAYKENLHPPTRIVQEQVFEKFFNPSWKFLHSKNPPYGTYYYNNGGQMINYYWHTFDQVIMRPQMINAFDEQSLIIVTEIAGESLLKNGIPDRLKYSDHLPVYFEIKEENLL